MIRICKNCKHYPEEEYRSDCKNENFQNNVSTDYQQSYIETTPDFGCIYFERR
jgi:hypothetical protein